MLKNKVTIQTATPYMFIDDQTVILSERIIREQRIPTNRQVLLDCGSCQVWVKIIPIRQAGLMRVSEDLAERMGARPGAGLRVRYRPDSGKLTAGPVIGVLVSRATPKSGDSMFGSNTDFCRELTQAGRDQGALVFVFTPDDISASQEALTGWRYEGGWRRGEFPIPQIVHNRLTTRRLENKSSVQQFFRQVKSDYGSSVFNEQYLDKSDVFEALRNESSVKSLLPESHNFKGSGLLRAMCERYESVFLKPVRGSLGKGIIRVVRSPDGGYVCEQTNMNGITRSVYSDIHALYTAIAGKTRSQTYQIQQGLRLVTAGGRPMDFRALVQKNRQGKWAVTSIVARIAGNRHFVSNLARGGTLSTVAGALAKTELTSAARRGLPLKLKNAALSIAKGVEKQIDSHFGEFGVDLAVDRGGRVWLLEVNSKPSKTAGSALQDVKVRPSTKQLLQYCRWLAGV